MIPFEQICSWAENFWPKMLKAELLGESLFPKTVNKKRFPKSMPPAEQLQILEQVRNQAKCIQGPDELIEMRGFGYTYHLAETGLAAKNREARLLEFETRQDYLRFVGKEEEFAYFETTVLWLRERFPAIEPWLQKHPLKVIELRDSWDRIGLVLDFFINNPRPNLYLRELNLPVDTKFIERNAKLLDSLLEMVLPEESIDTDETLFEKKYGLQWVEPLIRICFLDPKLQQDCQEIDSDFGLPVRTLARRSHWSVEKILVVENLTTLVSLRDKGLPGVLGLHGHGYRVANFEDLKWLNDCEVYYWGDIDVQGFEILSLFRQKFPHAKSVFMDMETISQVPQDLIGTGKPSRRRNEPILQTHEKLAWQWAREEWRQIEQEHLEANYVLEQLSRCLL